MSLTVGLLVTSAPIGAQGGEQRGLAPEQLQAIAQKTLQRVQASGEIYAWEVAGPRDRIPHPCSEECACLAGKFSADLKKLNVPFATFLLRPKNGAGWIEVAGVPRGLFKIQTYTFHYITAFRVNNTWLILDPVVTGSTKLEPVSLWEKRLKTAVTYARVQL